MSCSTIAEPAEQAITDESQKRGRGRPKGTGIPRIHTSKFDIEKGLAAFSDLACRTNLKWAWDGTSYPKTKRSHGPNVESLAMHSEPLKILLQLAPNGYPDPYRLRDLLVKLQNMFNIFANCKLEAHLNLANRAILAADRWRIQCKHLVMLKKCGQDYGDSVIKELLGMITTGSVPPAEPAQAPAPAELAEVPAPAELAEMPPPPAEDTSQYWSQPVPYTADGVIAWDQVEDQLPECIGNDDFECEVKSLDFTQPQPVNIHPYFHCVPTTDCAIIGHKCTCPMCTGVVDVTSPEPPRKKLKGPPPAGPTIDVIEESPAPRVPAAPTTLEVDQTRSRSPAAPVPAGPVLECPIGSRDIPVPKTSMLHPAKGISIPENLEAAVEIMTNSAAAHSTPKKKSEHPRKNLKKRKATEESKQQGQRDGGRRRMFHRLNQPPSRLNQPTNPAAKAKPVVKESPKAKPKVKVRRPVTSIATH